MSDSVKGDSNKTKFNFFSIHYFEKVRHTRAEWKMTTALAEWLVAPQYSTYTPGIDTTLPLRRGRVRNVPAINDT